MRARDWFFAASSDIFSPAIMAFSSRTVHALIRSSRTVFTHAFCILESMMLVTAISSSSSSITSLWVANLLVLLPRLVRTLKMSPLKASNHLLDQISWLIFSWSLRSSGTMQRQTLPKILLRSKDKPGVLSSQRISKSSGILCSLEADLRRTQYSNLNASNSIWSPETSTNTSEASNYMGVSKNRGKTPKMDGEK